MQQLHGWRMLFALAQFEVRPYIGSVAAMQRSQVLYFLLPEHLATEG